MSVADKARLLYGPYITDENLSVLEGLDAPDQEYFWTKLYYQVRRDMGKLALVEIEERVKADLDGVEQVESAMPFDAAEASVGAGAWFRRGAV